MIFEQLPEDLSEMILLRLPVKSLSRFKCISRSWCNLIKDPSFIAKHIRFNSFRDFLIISHLDDSSNSLFLSFLSDPSFEVAGTLVHSLNQIFVQILGPCNGIFCLFDVKETIALWNPAIKEELNIIPASNITPPPNMGTLYTGIGFGYDPNSDDYKVLAVKHLWTYPASAMAHAELYSLKSNTWKMIQVEDEFQSAVRSLPVSAFSPSIDGIFSWFEMDENVDKVIFSFDMSKEVFIKTHLPDYGFPSKRVHVKLVCLKNSLASVSDYSLGETAKGFDVWILGEYGVRESWTKYLTIGPLEGIQMSLGFSKSGELLFEDCHGQLICFDPNTEAMNKIVVGGVKNTISVFCYQESLVLVKSRQDSARGTENLQSLRFNFDPFVQFELNPNVL